MPDPTWYNLRLLRSQPPGPVASNDTRRREFGFALHQFEELIEASRSVTATTQPMTLYYALCQAGLAIIAAHGRDSTGYNTHGLTLRPPSDPLMSTIVTPTGKGKFRIISQLLQSSADIGDVELGRLWNLIPDLTGTPLPRATWPVPLPVVPRMRNPRLGIWPGIVQAAILTGEELTLDQAKAKLKEYPDAGKIVVAAPGVPAMEDTMWGRGMVVTWGERGGSLTLDDLIPEYRFHGERWLLPQVAPGKRVNPLLAWWTLLYALSMLARYYPVQWSQALDVDRSPLAVPLSDALEVAISVLPHLVLEALVGKRISLRTRFLQS